ncbi:hypothetical protein BaRGS_00003274 [Batillaria attramentaria]|uniref:Uncharacterized protein n=1 Tax=Batillaria attramentaria TaxID=370345 RepID=A0ABD0M1D1_9CAEN
MRHYVVLKIMLDTASKAKGRGHNILQPEKYRFCILYKSKILQQMPVFCSLFRRGKLESCHDQHAPVYKELHFEVKDWARQHGF